MKKTLFAIVALLTSLVASAQLPEGFSPAAVQNLEANWVVAENGQNNVVLTFTTPTQMMDMFWEMQDMTADITKIEISRSVMNMYDWEVVGTIDKADKGVEMTWTDANIPFGSYDYQVNVYVGDAYDFGSTASVVVGQLPADFMEDDFVMEIDENDPYKITLTVTLPTLNSFYEPLTAPITKVVFGEMGPMSFEPEPIYTEEAEEILVPGSKVQYVVEHAADGAHTYTVQVYTAAGSNFPAMTDVFIGKDQPGSVENLMAQVTDEGILVTWEAPIVGLNGGDMGDVNDITYTVSRGMNEYDASATVIAEGIKELSVLDKTVFTEESKFVYIVTATSPYGSGYPAVSNELVVGPAASLPFVENFDAPLDEYGNTTTEHSSWTKEYSGWYCQWQIGQNTVVNGEEVAPHNGGGLLYAYYDAWMTNNSWDAYTTGKIDFSTATKPALTFWLYDIKAEASDMTLTIQTSTDGAEFTNAAVIALGNAAENGWREVTVDLPALAGADKGQVRFLSQSVGSNSFAVPVDQITIFNNAGTAVSGIAAGLQEAPCYNLAGQRVSKNAKGIIIVDGKKIFNK